MNIRLENLSFSFFGQTFLVTHLCSQVLKRVSLIFTVEDAYEGIGMRGKPWSSDEERHLRQLIE
jgi:hypothetical protein